MTLAELLATPAHAEALARQLTVTIAIFGHAPKTYDPHMTVEVLAAVLWDLAKRNADWADLPPALLAGASALSTELPLTYDTRAGLQTPEVAHEFGVWANAIDSLLRNGLLSELIERHVAQRPPDARGEEEDPDEGDG